MASGRRFSGSEPPAGAGSVREVPVRTPSTGPSAMVPAVAGKWPRNPRHLFRISGDPGRILWDGRVVSQFEFFRLDFQKSCKLRTII